MKLDVHPESLLRIPLVRQMMEDPDVRLVARAVDARWQYEKILPLRLGGFNPLEGAVYYPAESFFARWLLDPRGSTRPRNENDFLVKEALFAVHDYLHAWAYRAMDALLPPRLVARRDSRAAVEDIVFCHIVSEAVATVGLDYWFLCTVSLNDLCDIGTRTDFGLTTDYHERFSTEYRRYAPDSRVQCPEFFALFTEFYCSGVFPGFEQRALHESPLVLRWLEHELRYSRLQRRYARQWFSYLAPGELALDDEALDAPSAIDRPWKGRLITTLGKLLWDKVKHDKDHELPGRPGEVRPQRFLWRSPLEKPADFRFVNLNALPATASPSRDPASELHRAYQAIAQVDFAHSGRDLEDEIQPLVKSSAFGKLAELLRDRPVIERCESEPRDLFFLG